MNSYPKSLRSRFQMAAFTLTELLVTITIIIVLAALAMTGMSKMRASADKSLATRNISQLQLANTGYATENNGQYVPIYAFDDTGSKYVAWMESPKYLSFLKDDSSLYLSNGKADTKLPLNLMDPITARAKKRLYDVIGASFGYMRDGVPGGGWGKPSSTPSYRTSQLISPERTAAFVSATDWNVSYSARLKWETSKEEGLASGQRMSYRHGGKALVVYYDGHVGEVSVADIKKIDTQGGSNHIFWRGAAN
ncbi:MAG: type II secretion system protein [Akkermansiaceae bacterium]